MSTAGQAMPVAGAAALLIALSACSGSTPSPPPPSATGMPAAAPSTQLSATTAPAVEAPVAGDIPDDQVFVPYSPADQRYAVSVPEGWSRTDAGGAVVFTDKFNSVRVQVVPSPGAPTADSARGAELPGIAATMPGFRAGDVTIVTRKGGPAVLITYFGTSQVDPVTGKAVAAAVERYEFWRAGQEAIVTLTGAEGADNVDPWRTVSDSFRWQ
ncbi:hypothetical protein [Pseudonocardia sp. DLS-67]